MPELPEVESIKRVLEPQLRGRTIRDVAVRRPEVISCPPADDGQFRERLLGRTFAGMERRGKFLLLLLDDGSRIILHLRMTGCLLLAPEGLPEEKHTHVTFCLDNGGELRFSDQRRFGRLWLLGKDEEDLVSGMGRLGLEPFDQAFSAEYLQARLGKRKKAIKECLLDQSVVAGIGNIYSDEILFAARIYPGRPACSLRPEEWKGLAEAVSERLAFFIEKNEITAEEYLAAKGQDYRNTPHLQVYGCQGKMCPVCGRVLERQVIGGRGSVYCPECQKKEII